MAQGGWGTGTWDDALWDNLPVSGNSGTGNVGNTGVVSSVALTSDLATGSTGTAVATQSTSVTGVTASGSVGSVDFTISIQLSGVSATGSVGVEAESINITLSGVEATGFAGDINPQIIPLIEFDMHDGDKLKDRFAREKALREKRRKEVIELYERIVEGKEDVPEIVEPLREHGITSKAEILTGTTFDFDAIISQLHAAQQVWDKHIETDDEDVLLLL